MPRELIDERMRFYNAHVRELSRVVNHWPNLDGTDRPIFRAPVAAHASVWFAWLELLYRQWLMRRREYARELRRAPRFPRVRETVRRPRSCEQ